MHTGSKNVAQLGPVVMFPPAAFARVDIISNDFVRVRGRGDVRDLLRGDGTLPMVVVLVVSFSEVAPQNHLMPLQEAHVRRLAVGGLNFSSTAQITGIGELVHDAPNESIHCDPLRLRDVIPAPQRLQGGIVFSSTPVLADIFGCFLVHVHLLAVLVDIFGFWRRLGDFLHDDTDHCGKGTHLRSASIEIGQALRWDQCCPFTENLRCLFDVQFPSTLGDCE